jgi:hypothetical protein
MEFSQIEEDETYKIRSVDGGFTFGTISEKNEEDGMVTWRSDHPDGDTDHWARAEQIVCKVASGTYLADDGKARR